MPGTLARASRPCLPTSNRPLRTSSRRLWTAGSHHSSLCARSAPASPHHKPISNLKFQISNPHRQPQALDCCEHHSSLCVRSTPTRPPSEPARDREAPHSRHPTSPLSHFSLPTPAIIHLSQRDNLYQPGASPQVPHNKISPSPERAEYHAPLPTSPLRTSSRRLWTAVSITALPACGARLQAPFPLPTSKNHAGRLVCLESPQLPHRPTNQHPASLNASQHASDAAAQHPKRAPAP